MRTIAFLITACLAVSLAQADPPRPLDPTLPVGKWNIEFANGVVEKVEIKKDGTATVSEPSRVSDGKVTAIQGTFLFVCDDGRVERWASGWWWSTGHPPTNTRTERPSGVSPT